MAPSQCSAMTLPVASIRKVRSVRERRAETSTLRIASLLPGLTDLIHDLKLSDHLVATSHECDCGPFAKPVTHPKLSTSQLTPLEISSGWNALAVHPLCDALSNRICSYYVVDVEALRSLAPTILLTHLTPPREMDPSHEEVLAALESLIPGIKVINTNPICLHEIYQLYHQVANRVDTSCIMSIAGVRARLLKISLMPIPKRPRVAVVQWTDPLFLAGEWVAEIVSLCAQPDDHTFPGSPSIAVHPSALQNIEIVVFAICALDLKACSNVVRRFWASNSHLFPNWSGRFVCADATKLFSRVALSVVVTSAEVIAEIVMNDNRYGHKDILWTDWHPS